MKNYVQPGDTITVTAPYAVASGAGCQVGSIFGVACNTALINATDLEIMTTGVFDLAKVDEQAWAVGEKIYWNDTDKVCSNVGTVGMLIGTCVKAVAVTAGLVIGRVRLNGAAPATAEGPQAAIASFTMGTNITAATANDALADSAATNPTEANFNELAKEFGTKINAILAALRTAGIIST